jgi:hypothetical protein
MNFRKVMFDLNVEKACIMSKIKVRNFNFNKAHFHRSSLNYGMGVRNSGFLRNFFSQKNFYGMAEFFLRNENTTEIPLFRDFKLRNFSLLKNGITLAKKATI